jgi:hypothetical protein
MGTSARRTIGRDLITAVRLVSDPRDKMKRKTQIATMAELRLGDQLVRHDHDATLAACAQLQPGWPETCGCSSCHNFIAVRVQAFPDAFQIFLTELGIDANKEGEAIYYGPVEGNLHFYGGWFYLVGEVIEAHERLTTIPFHGSSSPVKLLPGPGEGFQYWFSTSFARSPAVFGSRVAAVEFSTLLPWALDEPLRSRRSTKQ